VQNPENGAWSFVLNGGIALTSTWGKLDYDDGTSSSNGWYHFNVNGEMDYGWVKDGDGNWYHCNELSTKTLGLMDTSWYQSEHDNNWYYLDPATGAMATGWRQIGDKWYYFETTSNTAHYYYENGRWIYNANAGKPLGSMYANEMTPDGYLVGADGAWIQQ
jgi:glucan-binding YG repeat protein